MSKMPRFFNESTIFIGPPGCGKTSLMTCVALYHLNANYERLYNYLLKNGSEMLGKFVNSNYTIIANYYGGNNLKSNDEFSPFKMMVANDIFDYEEMLEHAVYFITEGQRYYDSYRYKDIPIFVYTAFENRRHNDNLIYIDCQKYNRIASSIREVYTCFVRPIKTEVKSVDEYGNPSVVRFFYLEFNNDEDVSKFVNTNTLSEEELLKHKDIKKYDININVFNCYDSCGNRELFKDSRMISKRSYGWQLKER